MNTISNDKNIHFPSIRLRVLLFDNETPDNNIPR